MIVNHQHTFYIRSINRQFEKLFSMKDETLYRLFKEFTFEVYPLLDTAIENKWIKPRYDTYPSVKYKSNGMPEISNYSVKNPIKISDLFRSWGGTPDINLKEFNSYNSLENYLLNHKQHLNTIYPDNLDARDSSTFKTLAIAIIEDFLERYYHLNQDKHENEQLLKSIYFEVEKYIYAEYLNFDISIPLLFLQFEPDEFSINGNITLRRIKDEYQKARFDVRSYTPPISDAIITNATHELVFKNYHIKKGKKYFGFELSDEKAYPLFQFELFFNAIKIITNFNSGFAQILIYPHNWADFYRMDLPVLKGLSVRKYPNYFDDFYWNKDTFPKVSEPEIKRIAFVYNRLLNNENNKIQIANRRLRSSYLRDNEEDSILDIIIALETLLSDNEKGEITHKLALRTARLISMFNQHYNALQVFNAVKKIYDFRSAVVHGSHKIDSKREIKLHAEAEPISTISLANDFLREIIGVLIEHPQYLDSKEVDKLLLQ
jgi:hypothetical protein